MAGAGRKGRGKTKETRQRWRKGQEKKDDGKGHGDTGNTTVINVPITTIPRQPSLGKMSRTQSKATAGALAALRTDGKQVKTTDARKVSNELPNQRLSLNRLSRTSRRKHTSALSSRLMSPVKVQVKVRSSSKARSASGLGTEKISNIVHTYGTWNAKKNC